MEDEISLDLPLADNRTRQIRTGFYFCILLLDSFIGFLY